MASKKARKPNRAEKKLTRSCFKKQVPQHNNINTNTIYSVPSPSPAAVLTSPGGCCTPKAKKSRIPEMLTCPPAPKKQRVSKNCVLRRRQIVFFAPPEIELFFVNAHDR
ncbi:hypothetical protein AT3G20898 [Arabidopsis thaliana]|uniref:Cyclin-dependent protein kinase inhibitor SMR13 n=1 Tax=Arabidopsis thaliana TaxID=3702 RepID=SMR13_ARATH|nr:uncharacterized protein AT3G20898 [Arabidopsis thaliana]F4IWB3.1 RecName: Full=Cyclin-dependent protein kinase inhibitor SMR13; AltName: Full=Protein SIAMESE-RELATED 13 [Arabidopsis thaliana]AEE76437.1 hypothetical protein AT3G20898 [Arabidopsis thaliana]|eukprot:NP_001154630.1 hypothetical protein AT3G20898 [Arabidopsis thaliana]